MDQVDLGIQNAERDASPERLRDDEARLSSCSIHTGASSASLESETQSHPSSSGSPLRLQQTRLQHTRSLHPTELDRIAAHRLLHSSTVGSSRPNIAHGTSATKTSNLGAGKPFPPTSYDVEDYVVEFDGPRDPLHPQNWPMKKRYVRTWSILEMWLTVQPVLLFPLCSLTSLSSHLSPARYSRPPLTG